MIPIRGWVFLGVLLALPIAPPALGEGGDEGERAVLVEVKFVDDRVEFVSRKDVERSVPRQFGTPQLEPLFFEITAGPEGEVLFSGTLGDPRELKIESVDPNTGEFSCQIVKLKEANVQIIVPQIPEARELVVYRRESDDPEKGRKLLLRTGL